MQGPSLLIGLCYVRVKLPLKSREEPWGCCAATAAVWQRSDAAFSCHAAVAIIIQSLLPPFRAAPPSLSSTVCRRPFVPCHRPCKCNLYAAAAFCRAPVLSIANSLPPPPCRAAEVLLLSVCRHRLVPRCRIYHCYRFATVAVPRRRTLFLLNCRRVVRVILLYRRAARIAYNSGVVAGAIAEFTWWSLLLGHAYRSVYRHLHFRPTRKIVAEEGRRCILVTEQWSRYSKMLVRTSLLSCSSRIFSWTMIHGFMLCQAVLKRMPLHGEILPLQFVSTRRYGLMIYVIYEMTYAAPQFSIGTLNERIGRYSYVSELPFVLSLHYCATTRVNMQ